MGSCPRRSLKQSSHPGIRLTQLRFLAERTRRTLYQVQDRPSQTEAAALASGEHRQQCRRLFIGDRLLNRLKCGLKRFQLRALRIFVRRETSKRDELSYRTAHVPRRLRSDMSGVPKGAKRPLVRRSMEGLGVGPANVFAGLRLRRRTSATLVRAALIAASIEML